MSTAETTEGPHGIGELLSPEVSEALERAEKLHDKAARLRATAWRHEDPIRDWVAKTRLQAPRGRRWKTLLGEVFEMVAKAGSLHTKIHGLEHEALPFLRAALAKLRVLESGDERGLPPHTVERMDDAARFRTEGLEALNRAIDLSARIMELSARTAPEDVYTLIDERSRLLGESNSLKRDADDAMRRAFRLEDEPPPDLEEAAERAVGPDVEEAFVEKNAPEDIDEALEMFDENGKRERGERKATSVEDEEWERWLRNAEAEALGEKPPDENLIPDRPPVGEADEPGEDEPAEEHRQDDGDAGKEEGEIEKGSVAELLLNRVQALEAELKVAARAAEQRAERREEEHERALEQLSERHESVLRGMRRELERVLDKERKARAEAEERIAAAERERDVACERTNGAEDRVADRGRKIRRLEDRVVRLESDLGEANEARIRAEKERDEARDRTSEAARRLKGWKGKFLAKKNEIEKVAVERLASLKEEHIRLRREALEELAAEHEAALRQLEQAHEAALAAAAAGHEAALEEASERHREEMEELRGTLGEARDSAEEERRTAVRERNAALRLVRSLTRRLELAGLSTEEEEGSEPGNGVLSDELEKMRRALWCQESEIQGLRNLLIAWKEEFHSQVAAEIGYVPSKLGSELVEP